MPNNQGTYYFGYGNTEKIDGTWQQDVIQTENNVIITYQCGKLYVGKVDKQMLPNGNGTLYKESLKSDNKEITGDFVNGAIIISEEDFKKMRPNDFETIMNDHKNKDTTTKLFVEHPDLKEITFISELPKEEKPSEGILLYACDNYYVGEILNNTPHGYGILYSLELERLYQGYWNI